MIRLKRFSLQYPLSFLVLSFLGGCVPHVVTAPTLHEARLGKGKGQLIDDTVLQPREIRAEVIEIDPGRQEIRLRPETGRPEPVTYTYDINTTKVHYHAREYSADALEAGDIIAFVRPSRSGRIEAIRLQEPVQARAGSRIARDPPPRTEVIEGTVERVDYDRGLFEVHPEVGRPVTVSVPYNASRADVESFQRLRRGDYVRIEGDFINPDRFHLVAFLADPQPSRFRR